MLGYATSIVSGWRVGRTASGLRRHPAWFLSRSLDRLCSVEPQPAAGLGQDPLHLFGGPFERAVDHR